MDPNELANNPGDYEGFDGNPWNGLFVRSQVQIALDTPEATGIRMTPHDVEHAFGRKVLSTIMDEGSYPLVEASDRPAVTLATQREHLRLSIDDIAREAALSRNEVVDAERPGKLTPIRILDRLCQKLALNENRVGKVGAQAAPALLTRRLGALLRSEQSTAILTPPVVIRLAEAAWIIARQVELERRVGAPVESALTKVHPVPIEPGPAYRQGYDLARRTRALLQLDDEEPIPSMRALLGEQVGIPLLTLDLGQRIAGATLANETHRGIVVNASGPTENPWVRRITAAHELCHYLWDPAIALDALKVDADETVSFSNRVIEPVEQRANAFAVEFLAPQKGLKRLAERAKDRHEALTEIACHFGISAQAASYHLHNAYLTRSELFGDGYPSVRPDEYWFANEDFDLAFFPIERVPFARRGRFAYLVARAVKRGIMSADSGAVLLSISQSEFERGLDSVLDLGSSQDTSPAPGPTP